MRGLFYWRIISWQTCLERELTASNNVYDVYKTKSDEAKLTLDELKEKTSFSKSKISEVKKHGEIQCDMTRLTDVYAA
jgi:hypothetical protein